MSGTSSTSSATSTASGGTLGDVPPVTFPGVASGIDYNAIIEKYTAATLAQEAPLQSQVNNLTAANTEIVKLQSLFGKVQDSLSALSNLNTFESFTATPSNTNAVQATQISGQNAVPGTYTIESQTAATASTVTNDPAANAAQLTPAQEAAAAPPLDQLGTSISATNGNSGNGSITINGVKISYDVTTQSIGTIVNDINSSGAGVNLTYNSATGVFTLTATTNAGIAIGSPADTGNLESVLHLDTGQITGSGNGETLTGSAPLIGISDTAALQGAGNAGFAKQVSSGVFTINGVQITVNASNQNLQDVLNAINSSSAGVSASYSQATGQLTLTSSTDGPSNIVLGSANDTSNFLVASGLSADYGTFTVGNGYPNLSPTITTGKQASLTYQNPSGGNTTVYSSTNTFTSVIPGISLNLLTTVPAGSPYTIGVQQSPKAAETAINTFVTAYNNLINELNVATAAPVIQQSFETAPGQNQGASSQTTSGGPLYNNFEVSSLRDQLVQMVSQFIPSGSTSYNSLQSLGLSLDTASVSTGLNTDSTNDSKDSTDSKDDSNSFVTATSGKLSPLDTTTFEAALAADPSAVEQIFTGATGLSEQLGSFLTDATGLPTILANGIAGTTPDVALLTSVSDSNTQTIDSLKDQITLINDEAILQANSLRQQFTASETLIAELQSLQGEIAAIGH
jgi:flagellar hook-associated protein 2